MSCSFIKSFEAMDNFACKKKLRMKAASILTDPEQEAIFRIAICTASYAM